MFLNENQIQIDDEHEHQINTILMECANDKNAFITVICRLIIRLLVAAFTVAPIESPLTTQNFKPASVNKLTVRGTPKDTKT